MIVYLEDYGIEGDIKIDQIDCHKGVQLDELYKIGDNPNNRKVVF